LMDEAALAECHCFGLAVRYHAVFMHNKQSPKSLHSQALRTIDAIKDVLFFGLVLPKKMYALVWA
jgi:hypothetical protein